MPVSDEQLESYLKQKSHEYQALKEEAKRIDLSPLEDVRSYIEERMREIEEELPESVNGEVVEGRPIALKYYRCSLKAYERGDDDEFRICLLRAERNLSHAARFAEITKLEKRVGENPAKRREAIKDRQAGKYACWQAMADEIVADFRSANPGNNPSKRQVARIIEDRLKREGSKYLNGHERINQVIEIRV